MFSFLQKLMACNMSRYTGEAVDDETLPAQVQPVVDAEDPTADGTTVAVDIISKALAASICARAAEMASNDIDAQAPTVQDDAKALRPRGAGVAIRSEDDLEIPAATTAVAHIPAAPDKPTVWVKEPMFMSNSYERRSPKSDSELAPKLVEPSDTTISDVQTTSPKSIILEDDAPETVPDDVESTVENTQSSCEASTLAAALACNAIAQAVTNADEECATISTALACSAIAQALHVDANQEAGAVAQEEALASSAKPNAGDDADVSTPAEGINSLAAGDNEDGDGQAGSTCAHNMVQEALTDSHDDFRKEFAHRVIATALSMALEPTAAAR